MKSIYFIKYYKAVIFIKGIMSTFSINNLICDGLDEIKKKKKSFDDKVDNLFIILIHDIKAFSLSF